MKKRRVELMGLDFSVLGFGCWSISGPRVWNTSTDEKSAQAINTALELGINFFDVAPVYGFGHSEEVLGAVLGNRRKDILIGTKCGLIWDDSNRISRCLKRESVLREIDDSLKRLRTDYVDLYQIHWPDESTPIEETMEALVKIKESGKIRHIGISNFSAHRAELAMKIAPIVSNQNLYNMIQRNSDNYHGISLEYRTEDEIIPFCKTHSQAFLPYSPLCQGLLSERSKNGLEFDSNDIRSNNPELKGEKLKANLQIVDRLRTVAQRIGRPLNQLALNWILHNRTVTCILAGTSNAKDLQDNVDGLEWELDDQIVAEINSILREESRITENK
ncbi:MAG: aldo/keto reductase [Dethiobacter sp.]|jgi:aryl-alcohol dehydrogenase-like predicted oxidoreductase|nr:aldo/keto reductase [Dethiobacter sp.]